MNGVEALHIESKQQRLLKTAIWLIIFMLIRMLVNNAVGFVIDKESVMASTQTNIPKVSSTVSAFLGDRPFYGFLINVGHVAMQFVYPVIMTFALNWRGWKLCAFLPYLGYAVGAAVYYTVGVQSLNGTTTGINGLPYYILIPFLGMLFAVAVQLVYNFITQKDWLHSYVKPVYDPNKPIEKSEEE